MLVLRPTSLLFCALSLMAFLPLTAGTALAQKPKELVWSHAFDLACRKYGEADFSPTTKKFGVEVFKDMNNGMGLYLSEAGGIGVAYFQKVSSPIPSSKGPEWLTGLDLPVRKAGEKEFKQDTKVHSLEIFRDPNTDNWMFISQKGELTTAPVKAKPVSKNAAPKWLHSVDLSVRKGGVRAWKDAAKFGIEVYREGNTGNLIFISETGSIAVVPDRDQIKADGKSPDWLHGLDLGCRRPNETSFTSDTRKVGVEVYHDLTTDYLIYISEQGSIAVAEAPGTLKAPTPEVFSPQWSHGLNVKCRRAEEKEFSDSTRTFGLEFFQDRNLNVLIYVNDEGRLAIAKR